MARSLRVPDIFWLPKRIAYEVGPDKAADNARQAIEAHEEALRAVERFQLSSSAVPASDSAAQAATHLPTEFNRSFLDHPSQYHRLAGS